MTLAWRRPDLGDAVLRLLPASPPAAPSEPLHAVHEAFRLSGTRPSPPRCRTPTSGSSTSTRPTWTSPATARLLIGRDPLAAARRRPRQQPGGARPSRQLGAGRDRPAVRAPLARRRRAGALVRAVAAASTRRDARCCSSSCRTRPPSTPRASVPTARRARTRQHLSPGMVLFDDRALWCAATRPSRPWWAACRDVAGGQPRPCRSCCAWDGETPDAALRLGAPVQSARCGCRSPTAAPCGCVPSCAATRPPAGIAATWRWSRTAASRKSA